MNVSRLLLPIFLLLGGCGATVIPAGPPVEPPHLDKVADAVIAEDGARLPLRSWLPEGHPKAVVVAVHGFNDYSNAFAGLAKILNAQGIALYAYDQRGFGKGPHPGIWAGQATMQSDLYAALTVIAPSYPDVPLYVLGESMGGALAMVSMADAPPTLPKISGVILVAPAVWSRDNLGLVPRTALWLVNNLVPWMSFSGSGLHIRPSDNNAMMREMWLDPLVIKETRTDTINGLVDLMSAAKTVAPRLHIPVLMLYGEHDQIVPPKPVYEVMADLPRQPVPPVIALYAKGYHMLTRDLEGAMVDQDIASWIEQPNAPLPSGADQRAKAALADRQRTAG